jgi:hypothetical protein
MRIYIDVIGFLFFINCVSYYCNRFIIFAFNYIAICNCNLWHTYVYYLYFVYLWIFIKI